MDQDTSVKSITYSKHLWVYYWIELTCAQDLKAFSLKTIFFRLKKYKLLLK